MTQEDRHAGGPWSRLASGMTGLCLVAFTAAALTYP